MFTQLPTAFPKLEAVVHAMDEVAVVSPPPMQAIGQRLRAAFELARADQYRSVSISELRKLPFAYWVPPAPALPLTDPDLVQRYWREALPQAIESGPRREKRWLSPLFFAYCESFDADDQWFFEFAKRVSTTVGRSKGPFAAKLADMHKTVAFFQPKPAEPEPNRKETRTHSSAVRKTFGRSADSRPLAPVLGKAKKCRSPLGYKAICPPRHGRVSHFRTSEVFAQSVKTQPLRD